MNVDDSFLELLAETLEGLERPARAQFLQRFFRTVANVELSEELSLSYWDRVLERRSELSESLGQPVSLKTALISVLAAADVHRLPILMEYAELKRLQINAATDSLTGLYNRRLFEEYFAKELNRAQRYGHHLTLVIFDLHRFKEVNDRLGHQQGDRLLQAASRTLRKTLRASDYAFRIGGDEFAVLLPQTGPEQAAALTRRIRASYDADIRPMNLELLTALDYGLAVYPADGETIEVLTRVADERLYEMKRGAQIRVTPALAPEPPKAPPAPPPPSPTPAFPETRPPLERRKWERVSLVGTRAYAIVGEEPGKRVRVMNLSYGGVALEFERMEEPANVFQAVLHVPILPPVKVNLRKAYAYRAAAETLHLGCAFIS